MGRRAAIVLVAALAVVVVLTMAVFRSADGGDGADEPASSTLDEAGDGEVTTTDPVVPSFSGDADSPFCDLVRAADEAPVLDPFDAGLEPREVELRLRALRVRFGEFADAAPPELAADLTTVVAGLDDLDTLLDANGYDFEAVVESGADISIVTDPAFNAIGTRLLAYRDQVCDV